MSLIGGSLNFLPLKGEAVMRDIIIALVSFCCCATCALGLFLILRHRRRQRQTVIEACPDDIGQPVGPGGAFRTTHVRAIPVADSNAVPTPFSRGWTAFVGWFGSKHGQLTYRWSVLAMFLTLMVLGAIWYLTGNMPQNVFTFSDNWGKNSPTFTLYGPSRLVDIALIPFWVAFIILGIRLVSKEADLDDQSFLVKAVLFISMCGITVTIAASGDILRISGILGVALGAFMALVSFCLACNERKDSREKPDFHSGSGALIVAPSLMFSFSWPFVFNHGLVYATFLVICSTLICWIFQFSGCFIGFYGSNILKVLLASFKKLVHFMTAQDIEETESS
jgi:hypothetical protein